MKQTRDDLNHIALLLLAAVAFTVVLIYTRPIMVPFVISLFVFLSISPLVRWMSQRIRLPRMLAVVATFLLFLAVATGVVLLVVSSLEDFIAGADQYRTRVADLMEQGLVWVAGLGLEVDSAALRRQLFDLPFLRIAKNISGNVFNFLGAATLVVIFVMFLLAGQGRTQKTPQWFLEIQEGVSRYIGIKTVFSLTTGLLVGGTLYFFGVDLALLFAFLVVLLNFIPSIGSVIATLIPLPIVIVQFGFGWQLIAILTITGFIQFLVGNVLEPKLMGAKMDLHPVTVIFFLVFWGLVWGVAGMFLAVPITSVLKIVLDRIEATRPLGELLAGRIA